MLDYEDAVARHKAVTTAAAQYRTDLRFRALVQSSVMEALGSHGRIDPHKVERDAHDIATHACALLLAQVYEGDQELRDLRAERDRLVAQLEVRISTTLPPIVILPDGLKSLRQA